MKKRYTMFTFIYRIPTKVIKWFYNLILEEFIMPFSKKYQSNNAKLKTIVVGEGIPEIIIKSEQEINTEIKSNSLLNHLRDYNLWWAMSISIFASMIILKGGLLWIILTIADWVLFTLTGRNDEEDDKSKGQVKVITAK